MFMFFVNGNIALGGSKVQSNLQKESPWTEAGLQHTCDHLRAIVLLDIIKYIFDERPPLLKDQF